MGLQFEKKLLFEKFLNENIYNVNLHCTSKNSLINLILQKENEYIYSQILADGNLTKSKRKKMILDDEENMNLNTANTINNGSNNNLLKTPVKRNKKITQLIELESSFLEESSDSEEYSVNNETKCTSPGRCYIKKNYNCDYILYEEKDNGYFSDNGKRIFKSNRKGYNSDDETKLFEANANKKKKIFINKKSAKKEVDRFQKEFELSVPELLKLKKQLLLNKKTKRVKNKSNKVINISKSKQKTTNTNDVSLKSSKKRKHYELVSETSRNSKENKKKNYAIFNLHSRSSNISNDDRSVISSFSNLSRNNKKEKKALNLNIKNYFNSFNDKDSLLILNEKRNVQRENRSITINKAINSSANILNFFPRMANGNSQREGEIIKILAKLISNNKYNELLSFVQREDNQQIYYNVCNSISSFYSKNIDESNKIKYDLIEKLNIKEINNSMKFTIESLDLDFNNDFKNSLVSLFQFYKKNLSFFLNEEYTCDNEWELSLTKIRVSEHLIKFIVKNYQDQNLFSILENELKEISLEWIGRYFHETKDDLILIHIYLQHLTTFFTILKVTYSSSENNFNYKNFKEFLLNFIKMLSFSNLVRIYNIDLFELKTFNESKILLISSLLVISEMYSFLNPNPNNNSNTVCNNNLLHSVIKLLNSIFSEYLYPGSGLPLDINSNMNLKSLFIEKCKSIFNGNFLYKETFDKSLKSFLYSTFILQTNNINNPNELNGDIRKIILDPVILQLYHRYFLIKFLVLCDSEYKNTNFTFLEDFYLLIKTESYYNLESKLKQIDSMSLKK